ncbi:class B sortase [Arabiibacter massiliensis]|uniref:class B sortase n=1 Tax=Arabiibacter massiliensis TaxID=1870985 RepID=UPI001E3182D7|nr:class B sortase [Arabiibacter massiliensis]
MHGRGGARPSAQKPQKKNPWRIVFWVALVVFVIALGALGVIGFSYWQGQQTYNDIAEEGFTPPADVEGTSLADLTVDWDALKAINPDTVGWIYIPGTPVNYPIVHTTDNDKYLTHDFKGSEGWAATFGAIFLAAENKGDFTDANNIIYGHHLNDGSMFACVADFEDQATFDAHRTMYVLTPQGNYRLTTFSLVHVSADDPLAQATFADAAEYEAYVQDKIDRSVVEVPDAPEAASLTQTFALATCDNLPSDGRFVLYASVADTTVGAPAEGEVADPDAVDAVDEAAEEIVS